MDNILINVISSDNPCFCLTGSVESIIKNKRLLLTFKRLGYSINDKIILIPFSQANEITTLQEIKNILIEYGFNVEFSESIKTEFSNFDREELLFSEFTKNAKAIRNSEFNENPILLESFNDFQKVISAKMIRKLYNFQILSAFHMTFSQNACNFSVPGSGKTSIVYATYAYLKNLPSSHPKHVDKLLIIGPLSSFAPWTNEYKDCFGALTTFQRLSGNSSVSRDEKLQHLYSGCPADVTLIYHGGVFSLKNEIIDFLKSHKTMVVVDEAHRIKNPEGVWGRSITDISKEAYSRIILTGTPLPNGYEDLFNLFKFLYPYRYKEILGFHYQNLQDLSKNNSEDDKRIERLKENISPFYIRIKKEDLMLPPIEEHFINIKMGEYQREIYDYIENEYVESFIKNPSGAIKDILNRAKLIRLRQASTNPSLLLKPILESLESGSDSTDIDPNSEYLQNTNIAFDDSDFFVKIRDYSINEVPIKFEEVLNILHQKIMPNNEKVIIWTIFIQNAKILHNYLIENGIKTKIIIGETIQEEREDIISKFNNPTNSSFNVVIANPFAVAESISLHKGCHNAIYLERDYNASNFVQSKDRIHRIGINNNIITKYYYMLCENSIDEIINSRLAEKVKRMEEIISDEIPLFNLLNDNDETIIIRDLIAKYAKRFA